mgnify:FL=1
MDGLRQRVEQTVRQVVRELLASRPEALAAGTPPRGRRPLMAGNWKMNGGPDFARDYARRLDAGDGAVEVVLCPPAVLLPLLAAALGADSPVRLGAQNLHPEPGGAYTGEHAGAMLRQAGAAYVVVGHSERRALFGEDDAAVQRKVAAALGAELRPIVCVGEQLAEREAGATFRVLRGQLTAALGGLGAPAPDPAAVVVAYEPVWAIGSGRTASAAQAQEALAFVRERLAELFSWPWAERVRLLYGGSASPDNAAQLAAEPDVDGFLVGGAGLDPAGFGRMIARTAQNAQTGRAAGAGRGMGGR